MSLALTHPTHELCIQDLAGHAGDRVAARHLADVRTLAGRFWVQVSGLRHTPADGVPRPGFTFAGGKNATYIVDTGTTGIYLPREVVGSIMTDMKLSWRPSAFPSIACSRAKEKGSFSFAFGDRTINVPYSTLVLENTPGSCLFLVTSVESEAIDLHILGLGFLRAAYSEFSILLSN